MRLRESIWFVYGKNVKCLRRSNVIPFSTEVKTRALPASLENTKIKRPLQHRRFNVYRSKTKEVASMNSGETTAFLAPCLGPSEWHLGSFPARVRPPAGEKEREQLSRGPGRSCAAPCGPSPTGAKRASSLCSHCLLLLLSLSAEIAAASAINQQLSFSPSTVFARSDIDVLCHERQEKQE